MSSAINVFYFLFINEKSIFKVMTMPIRINPIPKGTYRFLPVAARTLPACTAAFTVSSPNTLPVGIIVEVGNIVEVGTTVEVGSGILVAIGVAITVGIGVLVGTAVAVGTGVLVGVAVAVGIVVFVGVTVAVGIRVLVGVTVAVGTGVLVGVAVAVGTGVLLGVAVAVGTGVLVGVGEGTLVGVGDVTIALLKDACEISGQLCPHPTFITVPVFVPIPLTCQQFLSSFSSFKYPFTSVFLLSCPPLTHTSTINFPAGAISEKGEFSSFSHSPPSGQTFGTAKLSPVLLKAEIPRR